MNSIYLPYLMVAIAGVLTAAGNICLKLSRGSGAELTFIEGIINPFFIIGIAFYAANVIIFSKSLDKLQVTIAYPLLTAVGYLVLFVCSFLYMGESISYVKIIGVFLILIGIYFLMNS